MRRSALLLCAINEEAEHHVRVHRWWEQSFNGDETLGLPWVVILGFLRLANHPQVFPSPLSVEAAMAKIDAWLDCPTVKAVLEKDRHWTVLRGLLGTSGAAGNFATDGHLAAFALTHDAVLVSCDSDFGRFDGLRCENPLQAAQNGR